MGNLHVIYKTPVVLSLSNRIHYQQKDRSTHCPSLVRKFHQRSIMDSKREVSEGPAPEYKSRRKSYHRIAKVRVQQGRSLRSIARQSGIALRVLRSQERPGSNLTLQELYFWKDVLDVPIEILLIDRDEPLTESLRDRACLVKIMKTVMALSEIPTSARLSRLVSTLKDQLIDLMPELSDVRSWPSTGSHRPIELLGRAVREPIAVDQLRFSR